MLMMQNLYRFWHLNHQSYSYGRWEIPSHGIRRSACSFFGLSIILEVEILCLSHARILHWYWLVCRFAYDSFHPLNIIFVNFLAAGWIFQCPLPSALIPCSRSYWISTSCTFIHEPSISNVLVIAWYAWWPGAIFSVLSSDRISIWQLYLVLSLPACGKLIHLIPRLTIPFLCKYIIQR